MITITRSQLTIAGFQFLGIPPKGEPLNNYEYPVLVQFRFQFLGIPPKGERVIAIICGSKVKVSFQFLGIPPKGELKR